MTINKLTRETAQLDTCPFCGGPAKMIQAIPCCVGTAPGSCRVQAWGITSDGWNRRATPTPVSHLAGTFDGAIDTNSDTAPQPNVSAVDLAKMIAERMDFNLRTNDLWSDAAKEMARFILGAGEPFAWYFRGTFPLEEGAKTAAAITMLTREKREIDHSSAMPCYERVEVTPLYAGPPPQPIMSGWQPIATAPTTGEEIIGRTGPEWGGFSCRWNGEVFIHVDGDDGYVSYSPTEWMPMPAPTPQPNLDGGEAVKVSDYYGVDLVELDMKLVDQVKPTTWGVFTLDGRFTNLIGEDEEEAQGTGEEYFTRDFEIRPLYIHPPQANVALSDKAIVDLAWKHFGSSIVFTSITREKSPPMIPQEVYDVPTLALRQFVDDISAAIAAAEEGE